MTAIQVEETDCAHVLTILHSDFCLCKRLEGMLSAQADNLLVDSEEAVTLYAVAAIMAGLAARLEYSKKLIGAWLK
jgi:hypothetical protein